jgi:hypothetical protein
MNEAVSKIRPKERDTIIQALSAGVVPRVGLAYIQVGRAAEVAALLRDIDRVADGGSSVRFVIGEYGAGKTFFANLVRLMALERKCATVHADLAPNRRIHAGGGQARALYSEAVKNLATRTKPEGNALASIVERFVTDAVKDAADRGVSVEKMIDEKLARIQEFVGGYDFAVVLKAYWKASEENDETLKAFAIRWLRAEYSTKTEARQALGVRTIIDDDNVYESLKALACFVRLAGYAGLLVMFDEMVNIYKLQNSQARNQNYEQILRIVNDSLQGNTAGIGFIMCGTPEFLLDTRRGLYSYEALQSRLAERSVAKSDAGGSAGVAGEHPGGVRLGSPPEISGPGRGPDRVHGSLQQAYRRGLFQDATDDGEGVCPAALRARAKSGSQMARCPRPHRNRTRHRKCRRRRRRANGGEWRRR